MQPEARRSAPTAVFPADARDTLVNSVEGVGRAATLLKQVALLEQPDWKPAAI